MCERLARHTKGLLVKRGLRVWLHLHLHSVKKSHVVTEALGGFGMTPWCVVLVCS